MNFKEFLTQETKELSESTYDETKFKQELIKEIKPLHDWLKKEYGDLYAPYKAQGVEIVEYYGKSIFAELYAELKDQSSWENIHVSVKNDVRKRNTGIERKVAGVADDELKKKLSETMSKCKKIFKKYNLTIDKDTMKPGTASRAKPSGDVLLIEFYIGWVKP